MHKLYFQPAARYSEDIDLVQIKAEPFGPVMDQLRECLSFLGTPARKQKEQIIYSGFIAQDVEKAAKELGFDFSGVDAAKNDKDLYGLRYSEFVVPLVKAVQELQLQLNDMKEEIDLLKKENKMLLQLLKNKN